MLEYSVTDEKNFSLHDCRASGAAIEGDKLCFGFKDGVWLTGGEAPIRTGAAEVVFALDGMAREDACAFVFKPFGRESAIRQRLSLEKLTARLNAGKWELEFLYQYTGSTFSILECCLWSERRPYHRECELWLPITGAKVDFDLVMQEKDVPTEY